MRYIRRSMQKIDVAIIGGGIAGLWLLNLLVNKGYSVVLLEKKALGAGQTSGSQGLIHGGIKYALRGSLTDSSENIATMPSRWKACLAGNGTLDLSKVKTLSDDYFLVSESSLTSKMTAFFGSKTVAGRVAAVENENLPIALRNKKFKGLVYRLPDFVIDTHSLLEELSLPHRDKIYTGDFDLSAAEDEIKGIKLADGTDLFAKEYILAAGSGNRELINLLGLPVDMQFRPLKQVIVYGPELPEFFGHSVNLKAGDKPSLTITTHYLKDNTACWYLGGELAESGIKLSDEGQIAQAKYRLHNLLPWLNFSNCRFKIYNIDRAEPSQKDQKRPGKPYAKKFSNIILCWPTKLTLTPLLGDMVSELIDFPALPKQDVELKERVIIANPPWAVNET